MKNTFHRVVSLLLVLALLASLSVTAFATGTTASDEAATYTNEDGTITSVSNAERASATKIETNASTDAYVLPDAWYMDYVNYVVLNGLMSGVSETEFAPKQTVTRAMMVATLYNLAGQPEVAEYSTFADVRQSAYYAKAVAWA